MVITFTTSSALPHRKHLCAAYGSYNKQRLFPLSAIIVWSL